MTWRELNLWAGEARGYRALMGRMLRRVTGLGLACAALLVAPSLAEADPTGSVSGWHSPAAGDLDLSVWATPDGADLRSASARLGPVQYPAVAFEPGCCPAKVTLPIDTKDVGDGFHQLAVTVEDVNGVVTTIDNLTLEVDNTPPASPCEERDKTSCTLTVSIGSGTVTPQTSPPDGGPVGPDAGPSCASPRLSMALASKPLRFRRGVPVLKAGKRYRYLGELTCRINGRRRPALRGTEVEFLIRLGDRTLVRESLTVRKDRRLLLKVAYPAGSRVLLFRVRGAGGDTVSVRVPIRVIKVFKRGRR
jgi:hypothetical protein